MSRAVAFDTLKFVERLEAGGFTHDQAKAAAEAFAEATSQELATKTDIFGVEAKIETMAANLKVDILRWLIVTQIALGGFLFAAMKFTK